MKSKLCLCLVVAVAALPAYSAELPQRKSGLWEVKVDGARGGLQVMRMCIDRASDNALRGVGGPAAAQNCSKSEVRRESANRMNLETFAPAHAAPLPK